MFPGPDFHTPGIPAFLPALLADIAAKAPHIPLDPVVLQSVLLCLITGDKHLLLYAPGGDQEVRVAVKLVFLTLSSIFGLATHKLKIRPRAASPTTISGTPFLRSLFLPWSTPIEPPDEALSLKSAHKRVRNSAAWARPTSQRPRRRSVSSNEPASSSNPFSDSHEALASAASTTPKKTRVPLPHAFSDPTPTPRHKRDRSAALQPRAVVISGLENTTLASQRALTRALAERRVVLEDEDGDEAYDEVWNLPDNSILVYVCPFDARDRPPIDKTLLDKFAMSATPNPHPSVRALLSASSRNSASYRNSPALHSSSLPHIPSSSTPPPHPHHSHTISLPVGHHHHVHHPPTLLHGQHPLIPVALLHDLREAYQRTHLSPSLRIYAADLFSAARHHPQLDGMLLTARAMKDAIDLAKAGRVVGGDLTGIELVREEAAVHTTTRPRRRPKTDENVGRSTESVSDSTSGSAPEPVLAGPGLAHAHRYQQIEVVVEEVDGETTPPPAVEVPEPELPVYEVSEADVARIAPRVMTHRLRVRDGPHDEVLGSARYPAVSAELPVDGLALEERSTIKAILVGILAEV